MSNEGDNCSGKLFFRARNPFIYRKIEKSTVENELELLREQMESSQYRGLSFEKRFGLLLDREWTLRQQRKQKRRVRVARFRETAVIEDLDLSLRRGLDRGQSSAYPHYIIFIMRRYIFST